MRGSLRTRLLIFIVLSIAAVLIPNLLRQAQQSAQAEIKVQQQAVQRALDFKLDTLRGHLSSYQFTLGIVRSESESENAQALLANATNNFLTLTKPELRMLEPLVKRQDELTRKVLGRSSSSQFTQLARLEGTFRQIGPIADEFLESFGTDMQSSLEMDTLAQLLQVYRASLFDLDETLKRDS